MDGIKMRRSRIDIVVDILGVTKNGVNKTAIVYRTNINFTLAEKYIELLEKQGFLENNSEKYITTDKGKIFLQKAKEITLQLEEPIQNAKEIIPQREPGQNTKEMMPWLEATQKAKSRSPAAMSL